jgi:hypothetical protein
VEQSGESEWLTLRRIEDYADALTTAPGLEIREPPPFCAYADGRCEEPPIEVTERSTVFLYSSRPMHIASTIEKAVDILKSRHPQDVWKTWRDFDIAGHLIFCEICKAMRASTTVVADVTTLNFNLLFEIGFCIGLGLPVVPIRDETYMADKRVFEAMGLLDTLGYKDFVNAEQLADKLSPQTRTPLARPARKTYTEAPLYVLKGPIDTEGAVRLMSTLKKSPLRFRTYDPIETPRLSLSAAWKQVTGSFGVVSHLLSPNREAAGSHNAMAAMVSGIAMAEQKVVAMIQEEIVVQPIDYRDVVQSYEVPDHIPALLEAPIARTIERMQAQGVTEMASVEPGTLELLDIGDVAAENEILGLRDYFVRTSQFQQAINGHARLVVGRKGSGKTAIFYEARDYAKRGHQSLVLDLKPDGHQFTKLREAVLSELSLGQQEHTITAFWTYILLAEIGHKILHEDYRWAQRDHDRLVRYQALEDEFLKHGLASGEDLSQRLLRLVDRVIERFRGHGDLDARADLTELVYGRDIRALSDAINAYLRSEKEELWFLLDNIDKSWVARGTTAEDVLIVRGLLEATRKLEGQLEQSDVTVTCLVFLRTDLFDHLFRETPDRGKDTPIRLDWDDPDVFKEIVRRRIEVSTSLEGDFERVWRAICTERVGAEDSFGYLLARTLLRPRDLLTFVQRSIEVAVNRGHSKITADDIKQAETSYSEDMLLALVFELDDTHPELSDSLYGFHGQVGAIERDAACAILRAAGVPEQTLAEALELLLWFGFLGARDRVNGTESYAHEVRFNLRRLTHPIDQRTSDFIVHPAYRSALGTA